MAVELSADVARAAELRVRRGPGIWRSLALSKKATVGLTMTGVVLVLAVAAPILSPYDPAKVQTGPFFAPPSLAHPLGTDNLGRDVFSRIVWGSRISLAAGLFVSAGALLIGVPLGILAGYFGRAVDGIVMRAMDVLFAFPSVLMALFLAAIIGRGMQTVLLALILANTPTVARLARSVALSVREREYVQAARAIGQRADGIMLRHILPNCLAPIVVQASLVMSYAILAEAAISYLGLGTQSPEFSWGLMLSDSSDFMFIAPRLAIWPGLSIMFVVFAFNFLGDGLRDVLDPRQRAVLAER